MAYMQLMLLMMATAFGLSALTKKKFEETLAPSAFLFIVVLYCFSLAGHLSLGVPAIMVLAAASLGYGLFDSLKKDKGLPALFFTPGLVAFILLATLSWYATSGRTLALWDEFSHWGLVAKNMFFLNSFGNGANSSTVFAEYPPGISLFQYLLQKINGSFGEPLLYRATNLLIISTLVPVFKETSWRDSFRLPLLFFVVLVLPMVFIDYNLYFSIYVDGLLGLIFAWILYAYFGTSQKRTLIDFAFIGLGCFVLSLIKLSGTGFATIALLIIAADMLLLQLKDKKPHEGRSIRQALPALLPLLGLLLGKFSWRLYLYGAGISSQWSNSGEMHLSPASLLALMGGKGEAYQYQAVNTFMRALVKPTPAGFVALSPVAWLAVMAATGAAACYICRKNRPLLRQTLVAVIGTVVGAVLFLLSLLLSYLFSFKADEAIGAASFLRYAHSYFLGGMVFLTCLMLCRAFAAGKATATRFLAAAVAVSLVLLPAQKITDAFINPGRSISENALVRQQYYYLVVMGNSLNPATDRLYFVNQHENMFTYNVTAYSISPCRLSPMDSWTLTPENGNSPEEWATILREGYTHVFLNTVDDAFIQNYGSLFEDKDSIQNHGLYRVVPEGSGVRLVLIDTFWSS